MLRDDGESEIVAQHAGVLVHPFSPSVFPLLVELNYIPNVFVWPCLHVGSILTARSHGSSVSSLGCARDLSENACQHSGPLNALFLSCKKHPLHASLQR